LVVRGEKWPLITSQTLSKRREVIYRREEERKGRTFNQEQYRSENGEKNLRPFDPTRGKIASASTRDREFLN